VDYQKELRTAVLAAQKAGQYLISQRNQIRITTYKGSRHNYATRQDLTSEKMIMRILHKNFPHDLILSEETSPAEQAERIWIVDPIDGTRNYANQFPYFSVSIALWENGQSRVGVVYAPGFNHELYSAVRGRGAWLNGKNLRKINPAQPLASSLIATGHGYFKGKVLRGLFKTHRAVADRCLDLLRLSSASLDICQVAAGRLGGYFETGLKPWDIAAAILILKEQRGIVTNYTGKKANLFAQKNKQFSIELLACKNKKIHRELSRILS